MKNPSLFEVETLPVSVFPVAPSSWKPYAPLWSAVFLSS